MRCPAEGILFKRLFKGSNAKKVLGVSVHADGLALAVVDQVGLEQLLVQGTHWVPNTPLETRAKRLAQVVKKLKARRLACVVTLAPSFYHLLQIESPDLPPDEVVEASRWRIKDMIDFDVEHAAVDVFPLPESNRPGAPKLMYAVAADKTLFEPLMIELQGLGVRISAIDISEMALRNLVVRNTQSERPRAYFYLSPSSGLIEINHQADIYLTRNMAVGAEDVIDQPSELLHIAEGLALEVQRSLDYFESQYGLGQVDGLQLLAPNTALAEAFNEAAAAFLTVPVIQDKLEYLTGADMHEEQNAEEKLIAIGGGARNFPWAA